MVPYRNLGLSVAGMKREREQGNGSREPGTEPIRDSVWHNSINDNKANKNTHTLPNQKCLAPTLSDWHVMHFSWLRSSPPRSSPLRSNPPRSSLLRSRPDGLGWGATCDREETAGGGTTPPRKKGTERERERERRGGTGHRSAKVRERNENGNSSIQERGRHDRKTGLFCSRGWVRDW